MIKGESRALRLEPLDHCAGMHIRDPGEKAQHSRLSGGSFAKICEATAIGGDESGVGPVPTGSNNNPNPRHECSKSIPSASLGDCLRLFPFDPLHPACDLATRDI